MLKLREKYKNIDFNKLNPHPREKGENLFVNQDKIAVLLIHGLTSTPKSLENIAQFFVAQGFTVKNICLPGHKTHIQNLEGLSFNKLRQAVWQAVEDLIELDKEIYIIGHSLGGNLAIDACTKFSDKIKGGILVGTPFKFKRERLIKFLIPLYLTFRGNYYLKPWKKKDIKNKKAVSIYNKDGGYNFLPLKQILQLMLFAKLYTRQQVKKLKLPLLLIHSRHDQVASPRSAKLMYKQIFSNNKELLLVNGYTHSPLEKNFGGIFERVFDFIKRAQIDRQFSQVVKFDPQKARQEFFQDYYLHPA